MSSGGGARNNNLPNNNGTDRDREQRLRERERGREDAIVMAAIRRHAEQQQRVRVGAGVVGGGGAPGAGGAGAEVRIFDRAISPRSSGSGGSGGGSPHGIKRKVETAFGPETVEQWASTELEQETFSFLWSIKNYAAMSSGSEEIKSPTFKGGPKSCHQWQMKMCPKKKIDETEYFAVHLILNAFGDGDTTVGRKLKVRFQISLLDPEGRPLKQAGSPTMTVCEFKKYSVWGYDKFLQTVDITSPTRRLVEDDTLKIHCRVWIEGELKHRVGQGGASLDKDAAAVIKRRRFELLSQNMHDLLVDCQFADVALSTPTKTFMVHKAILCARSTVFRAMLNAPMLESVHNTIEIADFEEDVVKAMLDYIYTGETLDLNEKAADLMQISEKYDLGGLKEDCELAIATNLTVENAAEVLVLAHLHNAATLKGKVIDFINRNKDDVKKTPSFQDVAHSNAAVFVDLYLSQ